MSEPLPDEDLQALFDRQRRADHERTPTFHALRSRALTSRPNAPRRIPAGWRWAMTGTAAFGLALAAILALHQPVRPPLAAREMLVRQLDQVDAALEKSLAAQSALTAWQSPTDFLLNSTINEHRP
jgi:hypothetical protein